MIRYRCDGCGCDLPPNDSSRFIVKIEVFASASTLEISAEDLAKDHAAEIEALIKQTRSMPLEELEDGVYRSLQFDLCPACRRRYLADPIGPARPPAKPD